MLKKITMITCSIAAAFIGNATAAIEPPLEGVPVPTVSTQMRPPMGNMDDLLKMIQTLPEVKGFTKEDYARRTESLTVAFDVKFYPATRDGYGFGITVPRLAPPNQVDRYTLTSILNLQKGDEPVGVVRFWETYAVDARKIGYTKIAESLNALEAMHYLRLHDYNLRKLSGSVPRDFSVGTMNPTELSTYLKVGHDQAQNLLTIVAALPSIENVVTSTDDWKALATMSLDEARTWYDTKYAEKFSKYTQQYETHQRVVQNFIRECERPAASE